MRDFTEIEYTVDLSREEYVRSQEILAKRMKGLTRGARVFSLAMLVVCVAMGVSEFQFSGKVEWSLITLLALLVVSELWMMLSIPKQMRRRHEMAYDAAIYGGYVFAGTITVEADAIRKRTASATAVISFEQCRLFVETADMMIFCGMEGKSIVIPARFLTEENAEATRRAAQNSIPPMRQMLLQKVVPGAAAGEPFCIPEQERSDDTLLTIDIDYTDSEIVNIATEAAIEKYFETFPNKCVWMTVLASVGYFGLYIPPLPLFLSALLVIFLISIINVRIRMRRTITRTERAICRVRVEFTESHILFIAKVDGVRPMRLPWSHVTRAVDCRDTVELYTGKSRQLCIPKRCIADFEELRDVIDSHM